MNTFGRTEQMPPPWLPMPEQQHQRGGGAEGTGDPGGGEGGEGGYGGGRGGDPRGFGGGFGADPRGTPDPSGPGGDPGVPTRGWQDMPARAPASVDLTGQLADQLGVDRKDVNVTIGWNKQAKQDQLGLVVRGKAYDAAAKMREKHRATMTPQQQLVDRLTTPMGLVGLAMGWASRTFGVAVDPATGAIMGQAGGGMPGADPAHGGGEAAIQAAIDAAEAAKKKEGEGDTPTEAEPGTDEYKRTLREQMEAIIGGYMPDYGFELPDWDTIFALDFPPAPPQGASDGADTGYEQTLQSIYDRINQRAA